MKKTFEQWLKEVDQHIRNSIGVGYLELPDCCYYQWYENYVSPKTAARRAIKHAME
jgi:hypothetical protein